MKNKIKNIIKQNLETIKILDNSITKIEEIATVLIDCFKAGGKILICGNGGSAADSQHMAAELVGRFKKDSASFAAIALSTDTSIITSVGNDFGFEDIFARQIGALGKQKDVLFLISTSGNSENLLRAVKKAKLLGIKTAALLGKGGGKLKSLSDLSLVVDSDQTARIQEAHALIIHIICELIEDEF